MGLFADDIKWHVPGRSQLAGDYSGKEEVGAFFGRLVELTNGTFQLELHDVLANDDHGAALVHVTAQREGKSLESNDVHVWHLSDGRATEYGSIPATNTLRTSFGPGDTKLSGRFVGRTNGPRLAVLKCDGLILADPAPSPQSEP